jgi:pimeloyl-ACP methyl ester carboxylesterase
MTFRHLRVTTLTAALLLASAAAQPAIAPAFAQQAKQSPKGDWTGDLVTPQLTYTLGIRIDETSPGKFKGTIGSHQTGRWGTELEQLSFTDGALSFHVPTTNADFKGTWDAAASAWTGTYKTPNGTFPLKLAAGKVAPLPTIAGLDGRWEGVLDVQGQMKLRMVYRVFSDEHGTRLLLDSPDQAAANIFSTKLARNGAHISFDVPSVRGQYEGDLSADGATITGMWSQGFAMPLIMTRTSTNAALPEQKRPQTPRAPFPYKIEEVAYDNPKATGVRLACTLTTPEKTGRHPAAILITGSGPQDRDETIFGHKVLGVLADHLTRRGIAVLRCDDRGFGKSTGIFLNKTPADFSTDVEAGLAFLRTRPDIDPKRLGLIGHSEGSITGPLAANRNPDVAFIVMMGGVGVKGVELMAEQRTLIAASMGMPEEQKDIVRGANLGLLGAIASAPDDATAKTTAANFLMLAGAAQGMTQEMANEQAEQFASPYIRDLLKYDPVPVLSQVKQPVLAVTGSKDLQVPPYQNLPAIKALMKDNPDVTTVELPNLNHLFQTAKTGALAEYGEIEETFAPIGLTTISDWIVKRMKP